MKHRNDSEAEMGIVAAVVFSLGMLSSIVVACIIDGHPRPRV
jgi:hypothetical protein